MISKDLQINENHLLFTYGIESERERQKKKDFEKRRKWDQKWNDSIVETIILTQLAPARVWNLSDFSYLTH